MSRAAIRCFVADGHPAMLRAVADILVGAGFTVVGEAPDREDALRRIHVEQPTIAVLDAATLGMSGDDFAAACSETRVIIFTASDGETVLRGGVDPGALAYVSKSQRVEFLVDVVEIVAAGGSWVDPAVAPMLVARTVRSDETVTPREREVLELVSNGLAYRQVAERLSITVSTVQQHMTRAMTRLEAETRTQAVATAIRLFLIE